MECDYGYCPGIKDDDDDFVQDYSNYYGTEESTDNVTDGNEPLDLQPSELEDYFNEMDNIDDPMAEVESEVLYDPEPVVYVKNTSNSTKKKQDKKPSKGQRRRENQKTKSNKRISKMNSWDKFYSLVLTWTRSTVEKTFVLPSVVNVFSDNLQYFDHMLSLSMEECRANIQQELVAVNRGYAAGCTLELLEITEENMAGMFVLQFRIVRNNIANECFRTGCLFELSHTTQHTGDKVNPYLAHKNGGVSGNKGSNSSGSSDSGKKRSFNNQSTNGSSNNGNEGSRCFALISTQSIGGDRPVSFRTNDIIRMLIRNKQCDSIDKLISSNPTQFSVGAQWTAHSLGNTIPFQRMAAVCYEIPSLPFMHKLLGSKLSKHIKFDDSDGDDDESNGDGADVTEQNSVDVVSSTNNSVAHLDTSGVSTTVSHYQRLLTEKGTSNSREFVFSLNRSQHAALKHCTQERFAVVPSPPVQHKIFADNTTGESAGSASAFSAKSTTECTDEVAFKRDVHNGGLYLVQGPPGCGKTHLLSALLHIYHTASCRILVCAPSNKAVCVALEKYLETLQATAVELMTSSSAAAAVQSESATGNILSGDSGKQSNQQETLTGGLVNSSNTNRNIRSVPKIAIVGVEDKIDSCATTGNSMSFSSQLDSLARGSNNISGNSRGNHSFSRSNAGANFSQNNSRNGVNYMSSGNSDTSTAVINAVIGTPQSISDVFSITYNKRIQSALFALCDRLREPFDKYAVYVNRGLSLRDWSNVLAAVQDVSDLHTALKRAITERLPLFVQKNTADGHTAIHQHLINIISQANSAVNTLMSSERNNDGALFHRLSNAVTETIILIRSLCDVYMDPKYVLMISDEYIATADILFCTLSTSGNMAVSRNYKHIDILIIDESAQAFEPELLIPLALQPQNVIMIGDPKQLPATIISQAVQRSGLGQSAMQRLMQGCRYPYCLLNIQYRMHPRIAAFSNKQFYAGRIIDSDFVQTRAPLIANNGNRNHGNNQAIINSINDNYNDRSSDSQFSWLDGGYAFVNVEGVEEKVRRMGDSRENMQEAVFIAKLVLFLRDRCQLNVQSQVGIITFYAAQVACIKQCLSRHGLDKEKVKVLSVDSFQGSECDCIILSFVRSNFNNEVGFIKEYQRLNVALTRAKHLMISVGCARTLSVVKASQQRVNAQVKTGDSLPSFDDSHSDKRRCVDMNASDNPSAVPTIVGRCTVSTTTAATSTADPSVLVVDDMDDVVSATALADMVTDAGLRECYYEGSDILERMARPPPPPPRPPVPPPRPAVAPAVKKLASSRAIAPTLTVPTVATEAVALEAEPEKRPLAPTLSQKPLLPSPAPVMVVVNLPSLASIVSLAPAAPAAALPAAVAAPSHDKQQQSKRSEVTMVRESALTKLERAKAASKSTSTKVKASNAPSASGVISNASVLGNRKRKLSSAHQDRDHRAAQPPPPEAPIVALRKTKIKPSSLGTSSSVVAGAIGASSKTKASVAALLSQLQAEKEASRSKTTAASSSSSASDRCLTGVNFQRSVLAAASRASTASVTSTSSSGSSGGKVEIKAQPRRWFE